MMCGVTLWQNLAVVFNNKSHKTRWKVPWGLVALTMLLASTMVAAYECETEMCMHNKIRDSTGVILPSYSQTGFVVATRQLLQEGLSAADKSLLVAAEKNDAAGVRRALARGANTEAAVSRQQTALMLAARKGGGDILQILLDEGADVNARDSNGNTALHLASQSGRAADIASSLLAVETLIKGGADVNGKNANGRTPVFLAARDVRVEIVVALIKGKANPNIRDSFGSYPVHAAVVNTGDDVIATLEALAEGGAEIEAAAADGNTPLMVAAQFGSLDVVGALLNLKANATAVDQDGLTPLHFAAIAGSAAVIDLLVTQPGVDLNAGSRSGATPLMEAVFFGQEEGVEALIAAGAEIDAVDDDSDTALNYACLYGDVAIAETLVREGADVNIATHRGMTPLHAVSVHTETSAIAELLIREGANVEAHSEFLGTPLHWALYFGNDANADVLVEGGASSMARNAEGNIPSEVQCGCLDAEILPELGQSYECPMDACVLDGPEEEPPAEPVAEITKADQDLFFAISDMDAGAVKTALTEGADPNNAVNPGLRNPSLRPPLSQAAALDAVHIMDDLIASGANVNARDKAGLTPVHVSAMNGQSRAIQTLIDSGADVNVATSEGNMTALMFAAEMGDLVSVQILEMAKADLQLKNAMGSQAVHLAAAKPSNEEIVKELISLGVGVDVKDAAGHTPLLIAITNRAVGTALDLINNLGTDLRVENNQGLQAIHLAALHNVPVVLTALKNKGVDVNTATAQSKATPLQLSSVTDGTGDVTKTLLDAGADIDMESEVLGTALHWASYFGNFEAVGLLVDAGADVDALNSEGMSTIDVRCGCLERNELADLSGEREPCVYTRSREAFSCSNLPPDDVFEINKEPEDEISPPGESRVRVEVTIPDLSMEEANLDPDDPSSLWNSVVQQLADASGVDTSKVNILDVRQGSIIFLTEVSVPNDQASDVASTLENQPNTVFSEEFRNEFGIPTVTVVGEIPEAEAEVPIVEPGQETDIEPTDEVVIDPTSQPDLVVEPTIEPLEEIDNLEIDDLPIEEPTAEPELDDIEAPPVEEPVVEDVTELELGPVVEPVVEPLVVESDMEAIIERDVEPIEEPVTEPVEEEGAIEDLDMEPEIEPEIEELDLEPVTEPVEEAAVIEDLDMEPVVEPAIEPEIEELEMTPVTEPVEEAAVIEDLDLEPITEPEIEDLDMEPVVEPEIEDLEVEVVPELEVEPIEEPPISEPLEEPSVEFEEQVLAIELRFEDLDFVEISTDDDLRAELRQSVISELARAAGVDPNSVRVVEIKRGSVIVVAQILAPEDDLTDVAAALTDNPKSVFSTKFQDNFGVPVVTIVTGVSQLVVREVVVEPAPEEEDIIEEFLDIDEQPTIEAEPVEEPIDEAVTVQPPILEPPVVEPVIEEPVAEPVVEDDYVVDELDVPTAPPEVEPLVEDIEEEETVRLQLLFPDLDHAELVFNDEMMSNLESSVVQQLSEAAGVDQDKVRVLEVKQGSVVVLVELDLPLDSVGTVTDDLTGDPGSMFSEEFQQEFGLPVVSVVAELPPVPEAEESVLKVEFTFPDLNYDDIQSDEELQERLKQTTIEQVARASGVDPSKVKVVDIREGSVIVVTEITVQENESSAATQALTEQPAEVFNEEFQQEFGVPTVSVVAVSGQPPVPEPVDEAVVIAPTVEPPEFELEVQPDTEMGVPIPVEEPTVEPPPVVPIAGPVEMLLPPPTPPTVSERANATDGQFVSIKEEPEELRTVVLELRFVHLDFETFATNFTSLVAIQREVTMAIAQSADVDEQNVHVTKIGGGSIVVEVEVLFNRGKGGENDAAIDEWVEDVELDTSALLSAEFTQKYGVPQVTVVSTGDNGSTVAGPVPCTVLLALLLHWFLSKHGLMW